MIGQTEYCQVHMTNFGWTKYQDRAHKGRLVGYQANRFYRMLLPNDKVETFSNVTWINNVPPKPISMGLTPRGVQQANNVKLLEARSKRRSDAIDATQEPASTSVSGERASKRRREPSVEAIDFTAIPARGEYLTEVRISVRAQPPRAPPGKSRNHLKRSAMRRSRRPQSLKTRHQARNLQHDP